MHAVYDDIQKDYETRTKSKEKQTI